MARRGVAVGPEDGELTVHTGVDGPAARMGHRLTILVREWRGVVVFDGGPVEVTLHAEVGSFDVVSGEGGVKALSRAEKSLARGNALRSLSSSKYPGIDFRAGHVEATVTGYRLDGELTVRGVSRPQTVDVRVDGDQLLVEERLRQKDFRIQPFALMMGALRVADEVMVAFSARLPTEEDQQDAP